MNRPIKFRAWVYSRFHSILPKEQQTEDTHGMWEKKWVMGEVKTLYLGTGKARVMDGSFSDKYHDYTVGEECVVMQSTSLIDKNGKEIYEGDIVAVKFDEFYTARIAWKGPPDAICEVYWDYSGFHLKAKGEKDFRYSSFEDVLSEATFGDMLMMNKTESEVIGNIYENPELLENGKPELQ